MTDNSKLIQGGPEWFQARCGKITGSRFKDVLSTRGAARANYMRELLLERKTGKVTEGFVNEEMAWGIKTEPQARAYYEKLYEQVNCFIKVETVGFIDHPLEQYNGYVGVSPDGLIGKDGCIEIKCPNTDTHREYFAKNVLPSTYKAQVQGAMWVTCRDWCDFISFDPRLPDQPFWSIRVKRDEIYIANLAVRVDEFIQEMVELQRTQVEVDPQLLIDVTEGYSNENDWQVKLKNEIQGKVRMHVVCAIISTGEWKDLDKEFINKWVNFIVTGE
jgi:putative phage-type endonuclease